MSISHARQLGPALLLSLLANAAAAQAPAPQPEPPPTNPLLPAGEEAMLEDRDEVTFRFRPTNGVELRSADETFSLKIGLRVQTLLAITTETDDAADESATVGSFLVRRARISLGGNFFGKHNRYKLQLALAPLDVGLDDGAVTESPLLDAQLEFTHLRDLTLRLGQYKVPFGREQIVSSGDLAFVDRSIAHSAFTLGRDVGVTVLSSDLLGLDVLRYSLGVFTGQGRDAFEADEFELAYVARLEVLPLGSFEDYDEVDFERVATPKVAIGAAYAFLDDAPGIRGTSGRAPRDEGTTDIHALTFDLMAHWMGLSVFGAFYLRDGDRNPGDAVDEMMMPIPTEAAHDGIGWTAQAFYLLPGLPLGAGAQYSAVRGSDGSALSASDAIGGGVGWFPVRHGLKLQLDYFHEWTEQASVDEVRLQLQAIL